MWVRVGWGPLLFSQEGGLGKTLSSLFGGRAGAAGPPPKPGVIQESFLSHPPCSKPLNFHFPLITEVLKRSCTASTGSKVFCELFCVDVQWHLPLLLGMELIQPKKSLPSGKGFHFRAAFVSAKKAPSEFLSWRCYWRLLGQVPWGPGKGQCLNHKVPKVQTISFFSIP